MDNDARIVDSEDIHLMIAESLSDMDDNVLVEIFKIMFPEVPISKLEKRTFKIGKDEDEQTEE